MNDDPFLQAAQKTVITAQDMVELNQRLDDFDKVCKKETEARQVDEQFMNRTYSI